MIISKFIWGKWQGIIDAYNYKVSLRVSVIEGDGKQLAAQCSLETMYMMFPPPPEKIYHPNAQINWIIKTYFAPKEKTMLEKWIDYITPILIEQGIKRGLWDE